jgi:hypothetical protein
MYHAYLTIICMLVASSLYKLLFTDAQHGCLIVAHRLPVTAIDTSSAVTSSATVMSNAHIS